MASGAARLAVSYSMRLLRTFWATVFVALPSVGPAQIPRSLSDSAFAALVTRFSEPSGYFDTDNLISNEDSYLHPLTTMRRAGVAGGVYVGVGPDQNFSYIAAIRPHAAVIIDIRRDNLLQHLLLKSIFALSRNRVEYLALLFGKPAPGDTTGWGARSIDSLLAYLIRARASDRELVQLRARVMAEVKRSGISLSATDLETITRFHVTFIQRGPGLRFTSYGRPPSTGYPDYGQLVSGRDLEGRQRSFLASEDAFRVVKSLEERNLIIPVVGNFAGTRAFAEVAAWMRENGEKLSAVYASNVEYYLFRDGIFDAFAANLTRLPRDARSVIVRSCFNPCRGRSDFYSMQMTQLVDTFAALRASRRINSYFDLVSVGILPP
jgi:hypothetical protein